MVFFRKKMARTRLNGQHTELEFMEIDELLINLWNIYKFKYHRKYCYSCKCSKDFIKYKLKKRWYKKNWPDVNIVVAEIEKSNHFFIDFDYFKSKYRKLIFDESNFTGKI